MENGGWLTINRLSSFLAADGVSYREYLFGQRNAT